MDYNYRPASYWLDSALIAHAVAQITTPEPQAELRKLLENAQWEKIPSFIISDRILDKDRRSLYKTHPFFAKSKFLPEYLNGDVEIAKVEIRVSPKDTLSVRVRQANQEGKFTILVASSKYKSKFKLKNDSASIPLTLQELIDLMDEVKHSHGVGLTLCYLKEHMDNYDNLDDMSDLVTVSSLFYPGLSDHYQEMVDEWIADAQEKRGDDEDGDDDDDDDDESGDDEEN